MSDEQPVIESDIYHLQTSLNDLRKHRNIFEGIEKNLFDNAIKVLSAGLGIIVSLWHSKNKVGIGT